MVKNAQDFRDRNRNHNREIEKMKKESKQISQRERRRRKSQRQSEWLYTPEGPITATKVNGGYKLSKLNREIGR